MGDKLRIVFMGSPEFAATCLEQLIADGYHVVCVITTPDRKKGRGQKLSESEVKICALKHDIPVLQPSNLKDESFQKELVDFNIDLGIVVAFRMLPEKVWSMPRLGTINLHASLLPDYRGAAPINWAIINGEKKTGITTFFLKHEIDTGDVIYREEVKITSDMKAGELHDLLMHKGAELLSKSVKSIEDGSYHTTDQDTLFSDPNNLKKAPKIFKEDCKIDWNRPVKEVHNLIRGLSPYPAAWSSLLTNSDKELIFKVYESQVTELKTSDKTKDLIIQDKKHLYIACSDYFLKIEELQVEGKKRMKTEEFLKGFQMDGCKIL